MKKKSCSSPKTHQHGLRPVVQVRQPAEDFDEDVEITVAERKLDVGATHVALEVSLRCILEHE